MKKLNFLLLLLFGVALSQKSKAQQKEVFFNASVLSQPDDFHFMPHATSKPPGINLAAGYVSRLKKSNFFWEGQLSYLNVQTEMHNEMFYVTDPNDPLIPENLTWREISSEIGIKTGLGYKIGRQRGKHIFTIVGGATGYLPFLSKGKLKLDDGDWETQPKFKEDNFKYGILYGFYLKPTYQLRFKSNSPWALNIFGEANLLWRNKVDYGNPLFMAGGGLGVSYTLR